MDNHVNDLLPGYALDCLSEEETLQVSLHLPQCQQCRTELEAYQKVVKTLPLAIPEAEPSLALKQKILANLKTKSAPAQLYRPRLTWSSMLAGLQRLAPALTALSLVLIVLLAIVNISLQQRLTRLEANTPDQFGVVALTGTTNAPKATGLLVISRDGNLGTLVVDSLPPLDPSHQYQLWLVKDGKRTSGGVFSVSEAGYGALTINSNMPLVNYSTFGITVEPAGGSPGPTGDKVMGGGL